jgi:hypothetical protein
MAVGAVAAATLVPAAAQAATPCAKPAASPVFADWGDSANYFLAPDGGFEDGAAGWALRGGAGVAAGNEPFDVGGDAGSRSLSLPPGSSALSPAFCIRPEARTVRWMQRAPRGAAMDVEVVHLDPDATRRGRLLRTVRGGGWQPSPKVSIPLAGTGADADGSALVALRFTALKGRWSIDALFVDPRLKR